MTFYIYNIPGECTSDYEGFPFEKSTLQVKGGRKVR